MYFSPKDVSLNDINPLELSDEQNDLFNVKDEIDNDDNKLKNITDMVAITKVLLN